MQDFFHYDIAIITIEREFKKTFNGNNVRPLCLQGGKETDWDIPPLNADITIIGMGITGNLCCGENQKLRQAQFDQRGLIQSCPTGAKNFTNYVFCHPLFSGVI